MILVISKGPTYRWASFQDSTWRGRSREDSHTFWPSWLAGAVFQWLSVKRWFQAEERRRAIWASLQTCRHLRRLACIEGTATSSSWAGNKGSHELGTYLVPNCVHIRPGAAECFRRRGKRRHNEGLSRGPGSPAPPDRWSVGDIPRRD